MESRICTQDLEQALLTIVDIVYLGLVVVDKKGRITLINEKLASFFNVTVDDVLGKHITELMANSDLHEMARTGKPRYDGIQIIKNQKMLVTCAPIINEQGESIGAVQKISFQSQKEIKELLRRLRLLEGQVEHYKKELEKSNGGKYALDSILSWDDGFNELKKIAHRAALGDATILIIGESGTGKELFANAVHKLSLRRNEPFIKINCAAIPDNLLESELFGYDYGAFSGAKKGGKPGKFELADKGTLFLDEIGDMPLSMQAKLLRVLQDQVIERVGGIDSKKIDVRIIAATNKNLQQLVAEGKFREDLYYRINVITMEIPPLRERKNDIIPLAQAFITDYSTSLGVPEKAFSLEATKVLTEYPWPGNIRELKNCVERIMNLHVESVIEADQLPSNLFNTDINIQSLFTEKNYRETILVQEKKIFETALMKCNGNKTKAAKMLGISRSTFYEKLKDTGLN
jgi:transcriptional regulator with PAS, ATPase and Fis domain